MPKVSIVTITKNNNIGVEKTCASIAKNLGADFEWIIVDGDPSNNLFYHQAKFDIVRKLIIGSDAGISDAFNKGIKVASGDYLLMLNAGDELMPEPSFGLALASLKGGDDIVCFRVVNESMQKSGFLFDDRLDHIPHQGMFIGKNVHSIIGDYNRSYRIRMDYEFIERARSKNIPIFFNDLVVSIYESGGISAQKSNRALFYKEAVSVEFLYQPRPGLLNLLKYFYWRLKSQ